ncbi:lipopolysaccharide biosynthesis protein [Clostridium baratii]|nr:hypothetical protein [Clostridium baratii]
MRVNILFYIIGIFASFISRSIFIKILGANITGLNSLYTSLIGLLNVAELGVGVAVGYSLYEPLSKKDFIKIKDIMVLFKYYYNRIAKIVLVLGLILSVFLPILIKGQVDIKLAYVYYFIYLINCSTSYLFTYKQTLIIADQKQYKISYVLNISKILKIITQCICIYYTKSFLFWLIVEFIFNLIGMILANRKIDIEYGNIFNSSNVKSIQKIKKENSQIGKNIRNVFFHKIASFVIYQTDAILISIFSTLKETGIYANYMMIINSLTGLLSTAIGSIMPSIGNLIAEESREKSYDTFRILFLFDNLIAIFISLVTYQVINEFIVFWVGSEYLFYKYIVTALILNLYVQIARGSVDRFKDGFGIYWDVNAAIFESIINLIFSVVLAKKFGIVGIFIGTIISNITIVMLWKPYILFKEGFKQNIMKYIKQSLNIYIRNILIIFLSSYVYNNIFSNISIGNQFIDLIIHSILGSTLCIILIFILFVNMKEFKKLLDILNNQFILKIKKKFNSR